MKALFLTALAIGNRVSDLAALSRASILISPNRSQVSLPVRPGFLYKNQSISRTPPNIVVKVLRDGSSPHRLCPVDALLRWIDLSKDWSSDSEFLSLISRNPMNRGPLVTSWLEPLIWLVIILLLKDKMSEKSAPLFHGREEFLLRNLSGICSGLFLMFLSKYI